MRSPPVRSVHSQLEERRPVRSDTPRRSRCPLGFGVSASLMNGSTPTSCPGKVFTNNRRRLGGCGHGFGEPVATGRAQGVGARRGGRRAAVRADGPREERLPDRGEPAAQAVRGAVRGTAGRPAEGHHQGPRRGHRRAALRHHPERGPRADPADDQDPDLRLRRHRARPHHPGAQGPADRRQGDERAAGHAPAVGLRGVDLRAPARIGVQAAVRRLRQRHHPPRRVQDLPLPELAGRPDALVPRPRRPPHRRERLHGAGRGVPAGRRGRGPAADPQGRLRPAARHHRQDVRRRRQVHVRRRGPLRPLRRRDPGQRRTLAHLEGGQAQVPVPHPQRLALPRPAAAAQRQQPDDRRRHRRRPHARPAADRPVAGRHGRALRGRHRLRQVHRGHQDPAAQPRRAELRRLRPHGQDHAVRGHQRRRSTRRTTRSPPSSTPTWRSWA